MRRLATAALVVVSSACSTTVSYEEYAGGAATATPMPAAACIGPSTAGYLAVLGGELSAGDPARGTIPASTVLVAAVRADGDIARWCPAPPLEQSPGGPQGFVAGRRLAVVGCQDYSTLVLARAQIEPGGIIGGWDTTQVPWLDGVSVACQSNARPAAAVAAGRLYLLGGGYMHPGFTETYRNVLSVALDDPNDRLTHPDLPDGRAGALAVASQTHLYILGGATVVNNSFVPTATAWVLDLAHQADGWRDAASEAGTAFPEGVEPWLYRGHRALLDGGRLYLVAALSPGNTTVLSAAVDPATGLLAEQLTAGPVRLPTALAHATPAAVAGSLYLVGGSEANVGSVVLTRHTPLGPTGTQCANGSPDECFFLTATAELPGRLSDAAAVAWSD